MSRWIFEPGHSSAQFTIRHMMITWIRGHISRAHGFIDFDPKKPEKTRIDATLEVDNLRTGDEARDAQLKSADFLDAQKFPTITFVATGAEPGTDGTFTVTGDLTVRGRTRQVSLTGRYLGQGQTPYWERATDYGPVTRAGFTAETEINRFDFGVAWQDQLPGEGVVVGQRLHINLDIEAILESDLQRIERELAA